MSKNLAALSLTLLTATSAFAADVSYVVETPSLGNGVYFSSWSDENVLCQAVGYEKAAVGSASHEEYSEGNLIWIDEIGEFGGATNHRRVKSIVCVNWILPSTRKTHRVSRPTHPQSKALFTASSDVNGICKIAGFESGIFESIVSGKDASGPRVAVDASGTVVGGGQEGTPFVESVICLSKAPSPILELEPYFYEASRLTSVWYYKLKLKMKMDPGYFSEKSESSMREIDIPYQLSISPDSSRLSAGKWIHPVHFVFFPTFGERGCEDDALVTFFTVRHGSGFAPNGKVILQLGTVGNPLKTFSLSLPKKEVWLGPSN